MNDDEKYISATQMASIMGVAVSTVGRWMKSGRVVGVRLPSGAYVIPRIEVDRMLSSIEAAKQTADYKASNREVKP